MGIWRYVILAAAGGLIAGCNNEPVSVQRAMAQCMEPTRKASGPTGTFGIGADSGKGLSTTFSIELSTDYLAGRNPDEVFDECVVSRSGSAPDRSYSEIVGNR